YVGYDEGGQLTEAVRRKPYSVILFDEIEKAHPDVFNTLLQLLDDGRLTDSQGRTVDFRNCIVIMTSNIGSVHLLDGIAPDGTLKEGAREKVMEDLRNHFRPEFLNRVDETVVFLPLRRDQIGKIVEFQLRRLRARLEERKIRLHMSDAARDFVAEAGYDPVYGARPLKRYLQHAVETPLARELVSGKIHDGEEVHIEVKDENLVFEARPAKA
ncbi:AAA family ATPase, partial [uncultured Desulfovibrio sp.]